MENCFNVHKHLITAKIRAPWDCVPGCPVVIGLVLASGDILFSIDVYTNSDILDALDQPVTHKSVITDGVVGIRDIGNILFVYGTLDICGKVDINPLAVKPDEAPTVDFVFDSCARNTEFTAHNGIDVHKVTADTSVSSVDIPVTSILVVLVNVPSGSAFVLTNHIVVVGQVLGHPIVEHSSFEAVGESVVADDIVSKGSRQRSVSHL